MPIFNVFWDARGSSGKLRYDRNDKTPFPYIIETDDPDLKGRMVDYFDTPRIFWIPESPQLDDYRQEKKKPTESLTHFELALGEMSRRINVDYYPA